MTKVVQDIVAEFEPETLSKLRQVVAQVQPVLLPSPKDTVVVEHDAAENDNYNPPYIVDALSQPRTLVPFKTIENMIQASAHAWIMKRPLLHHLTVRWLTGGWSQHQQVQYSLTKWLARKCGGAYYIWAKEGNGGPHSHFLIHLGNGQTGVECGHEVRKILKRLNDLQSLPDGTVKCTAPSSGKPLYESVRNRTAYLCKGGGPEVCELLGIGKSDWACVPNKQAGVSQSLSEATRKRGLGCLPSRCRSVTKELREAGAVSREHRQKRAELHHG